MMADSDCESSKKWNYERKKLLLTTRLRYEGDFAAKRKKRSVLWERILNNIKEVDAKFPFSRDEITRKFLNFMVTYKRIKKRNNTSGEAATHWEFYEEMDDVYGTRSDVAVPQETLDSSLYDILSGTGDTNDFRELDSTSPKSKPKSDRKKCEVLSFFGKRSLCRQRNFKRVDAGRKRKAGSGKTKSGRNAKPPFATDIYV
ncbi:uncharacterized protein LOC126764193 [Bactrocera neohumeralis]|uniref:uncharacterized protein LOC120780348 n=1 Tax=Bactrocera tryoni TaxID=59916 RepID=UPI001A96F5FB|nr:uncharacterized protein LOC120780348 [Bactrocera tryoni]XP_050337940.1 uncharacterized protein LOC126764193 [Bactrocera neohumeralis]